MPQPDATSHAGVHGGLSHGLGSGKCRQELQLLAGAFTSFNKAHGIVFVGSSDG
jgi:hypothetical protein